MRVSIAIPEEQVTPEVIDSALEANTRLNAQMITSGAAPTFSAALRAGRVRWKPEPPGQESFDHAGIVLRRGHGDCDDLGPWRAGELRATGEDPGAISRVVRSGPLTWHAIVQRSNGAFEDPSRAAGMGQRVSGQDDGARAPVVPPMFTTPRPSVALQHHRGAWWGRADIPWMPSPWYAFSVEAPASSPRVALHDAVVGACTIGHHAGWASREDLARMFVAGAVAWGVDPARVLSSLTQQGVYVEAPDFNRAVAVGSALVRRRRGCVAARL